MRNPFFVLLPYSRFIRFRDRLHPRAVLPSCGCTVFSYGFETAACPLRTSAAPPSTSRSVAAQSFLPVRDACPPSKPPSLQTSTSIHEPLNPFLRFQSAALPPSTSSIGLATVAAPSLLQTSEPPLQLPCTARSGCAILSSGCCPTAVSYGCETASIH